MAENPYLKMVWDGVSDVKKEFDRIDAKVSVATLAGLKAVQSKGKKNVRSRLRGKPRWNRRGASARTGAEVVLPGPEHKPRSGGPGRFTGSLNRAVGGVKKPKPVAGGGWQGGMGVGGVKVTYLYRGILEAKYGFFEAAVKKTEDEAVEIWRQAWLKAIK